jgi:uncharacterized damage-inducible protein DinB
MSIVVEIDRLLAYSEYERTKWKAWIASDPSRLALPFQPGGRFPTLNSLFDHLFLVERRHLSRLEGAVPPDSTGVAPGDWQALFEYGELVRADLRHYARELDATEGEEVLTWTVTSGPAPPGSYSMTRRKLAIHILLHEVRHLAQVAYAARLAGHEPPGAHDYFYCPEG